MVHLLKYSSIFLPLASKNHLQVTGPPINESFCFSRTSKYKRRAAHSGFPKLAHAAHHFESGNSLGHFSTFKFVSGIYYGVSFSFLEYIDVYTCNCSISVKLIKKFPKYLFSPLYSSIFFHQEH